MQQLSSRLNDLMHCYRCVNADIIRLYISAMDQARKLIFSSYVYLPSLMLMLILFNVNIKQLFSYNMCNHNL